jgi:hypothetical protein
MSRPCCCCHCIACKDGRFPDELTVILDGLVDDDWGGGCLDLHKANGAWTLSRDPAGCLCQTMWTGVPQSTINYVAEFPNVDMCVCGDGQATMMLVLQVTWNLNGVAGRRHVLVGLGNSKACLAINWELVETDQTEPYSCESFANLPIPFKSHGAYGGGSTDSTCKVSA